MLHDLDSIPLWKKSNINKLTDIKSDYVNKLEPDILKAPIFFTICVLRILECLLVQESTVKFLPPITRK